MFAEELRCVDRVHHHAMLVSWSRRMDAGQLLRIRDTSHPGPSLALWYAYSRDNPHTLDMVKVSAIEQHERQMHDLVSFNDTDHISLRTSETMRDSQHSRNFILRQRKLEVLLISKRRV